MSRLPPVTRCCTDLLMKSLTERCKGIALAGVVLMLLSGCRTEDELIGRPWNTPKSWESGLPSAMTEGR
jgi:hypothetical protein